jgi:hypothetical protein
MGRVLAKKSVWVSAFLTFDHGGSDVNNKEKRYISIMRETKKL